MVQPTTFEAVVAKVQTLADGGIRVAFDLPEGATLQAAELMEYKRWGVPLVVATTPTDCKTEACNAVGKRSKRKSEWQAAQD